jgi:uncharacterized membrane protein
MSESYWQKQFTWILKANLIIWALNALIFVILIITSFSVLNYFGKITLLETGLCFLVGGAIAFSGSASTGKANEQISKSSERWSIEKLKSREKKANRYLLLAGILLIECLIISLFGI